MGPGGTVPLISKFGLAGAIELVCGLLIAAGLFTRPAAFLASGEMAAAFFMVHVSGGGLIPIVNKGEVPVLLCFVFLYVAAWAVPAISRPFAAQSAGDAG